MPTPAALLFTDLDGTLLDHETYGFDAARPALHAVQDRGLPLILTTSKTLAEVTDLNRALHNHAPVIVENGGALAFPTGLPYPFELPPGDVADDHLLVLRSPAYTEILAFIDAQREAHDYRLQGFHDMTADEVSRHTGLAIAEAKQAQQRLCSEPFVWHDSDARLETFTAAAAGAGLRILRGGRFHHLLGDTDKAAALLALRDLYAQPTDQPPLTIALGDSENDINMLETADIAVIVMRPDGQHLDCRGRQQTYRTTEPGPAGWNTAVETLLETLPI
jgi:mannosyl-3-phosphoglycerate phosphatase